MISKETASETAVARIISLRALDIPTSHGDQDVSYQKLQLICNIYSSHSGSFHFCPSGGSAKCAPQGALRVSMLVPLGAGERAPPRFVRLAWLRVFEASELM